MAIDTQVVAYRDGDTALSGFLAWDGTRRDRRPGVLVVHGGAGLDDHARGRARRFAEWGLVAFACDMYGAGVLGNRDRVIQQITEFRRNPDALCQRAAAGLGILSSHPLVDQRVAAAGYCFGGMAVLELARSGAPLAGVVSVHGTLDTVRPAQPAAVQAKILVCHGAIDPHVPMSHVNAFAEEMIRAGADWQLIIYGNAMHGFTHETATGNQPGVAYHAASDRRSASAIQEFFKEIFS
jgi:dienelactone hydrolase